MKFIKYHGTGNDFIIIDAMSSEPVLAADEIAALCRRNTGVGADGVIFACSSTSGADAGMRIFNADGSEAEMCGNGIRCLAKFLYERAGVRKESMLIETLSGAKELNLKIDAGTVKEVEVDMGIPDFMLPSAAAGQGGSIPDEMTISLEDGGEVKAVCLSMGNPHCVIFVDRLEEVPVTSLGPAIEVNELFPSRTNVEFAQLIDLERIKIRVWERGVGETASCGTGACAAFAAALHTGRGNNVMTVTLRGGDLRLSVDPYGHIHLTGEAVEVFSGELSADWNIGRVGDSTAK